MANVKNFGLIGVGSELQFGKGSSKLINLEGTFKLRNAGNTADVALTAAGITSSGAVSAASGLSTTSGGITATAGGLTLTATDASITVGTDTTLSRQGAGVFQFTGSAATMLPVGADGTRPTGATGMIRVNNTTAAASTVEYFNGTAWTTLATGGNAAALQTEVDNIEASLGTVVNTDGTYNGAALTNTTIFGTTGAGATNTSLTAALNNLATYVDGKNTLDEIEPGEGAGKVLYLDSGNLWQQALPGATSGVQGYDVTLQSLADSTGSGIVVRNNADGSVVTRSLVAPTEGFTITDADGVAGAPTFVLANDLASLEGLTTTGFGVRTATDTWATRSITGTTDRIVVTNGDGVASSPTIDLATVTQADSGSFVKVTLDGYGRVTGNTAVTTADITALVDGTYVNVTGDTMTGNLSFGGTAKVTGLAAPTDGGDATNKSYVDNAVAGLSWKQAVAALSTTNIDLATGGLIVVDGYQTVAGDRILVIGQTTDSEEGIYVAGTGAWVRATDADQATELNGAAVFVMNGTVNADTGWTQTAQLTTFAGQTWVQFSGAGAYSAGTGLTLTGTVFSVNMGAGITNLPTGEVGVDVVADKAIQLTSTGTAGQLTLVLEAAGGLEQSATGLKISAAGVTNAMLANSAITLDADTGTGSVSLGGTLNVIGTAAQGISTSTATGTITITASDATSAASAGASQKGVASFDSASFTSTAGFVTLNTVDVAHGGTGLTSVVENQLLFGGAANTITQDAALSFDFVGVNNLPTLTLGQTTINGGTVANPDFTITAAAGGDISLVPATGQSVIIAGSVGDSTIQSDAATALTVRGNTTLTLEAGTGDIIMKVESGTADKVTVSGATAVDYATGLANEDLVNKYYVDQAIASGASAGSIKAYTAALSGDGTTNIGAALPAGATVLSVKLNVTTADATATVEVGKTGSTAAYMTSAENDPSTSGLYVAETYVTEAGSVQLLATVASSTTFVGTVIVQYQVAQ